MTRRLLYVTLQATAEGQAAHVHVHEIVAGLRELGWSVELVEPDYGATRPGVARRLMEFVRLARVASRRLAGCDVLYLRAHPLAWWISRAARSRRVPVVQEVNGTQMDVAAAWPVTRRFAGIVRALARSQYRHAALLIAVSEPMAAWLAEEAPGVEVRVIPSGVNTGRFAPGAELSAALRERLPGRYVALVGALTAWHGIDVAIAATESPAWPDGVVLAIAGDGRMREVVESAAKGSARVEYLGRVAHGEVPGLLAGAVAGLSVLSSGDSVAQFGAPVKVYETLASGTPAIVTDLPHQAGIVRGAECGLVVPAGDADALAQAVAALSGDDAMRSAMGARARETAVAEHSWARRAQVTDEAMRAALERVGAMEGG